MPKRLLIADLVSLFLAGLLVLFVVMDRQSPPPLPSRSTINPTIASITPAGTDLVIGIGAADHLVAVCDLDEDRDGVEGLPKVGDFDHLDWEKIAAIHPDLLLTQFGNRMPADLKDRCDTMGIKLIDVRLDVIDDVYREAATLGSALDEQSQAAAAIQQLKQRLAAIQSRMANLPRIRVAIAVSDGSAVALIGPGTFHDQLLTIAGGINVAADFKKPYVTIDREQLMALAPDVVFDLEPAPTEQQLRQAKRYWDALPDLPAVKNARVETITQPYCLRPAWHLADLAQIFATKLHPPSISPEAGSEVPRRPGSAFTQ